MPSQSETSSSSQEPDEPSISLEEIQAAIKKLDRSDAAIVAGRAAWRVMPLLFDEKHGFDYWPEKKGLNIWKQFRLLPLLRSFQIQIVWKTQALSG